MLRFLLTILILGVLALIAAIATGLLNLNTSGQLRAPSVEVKAAPGELPKVDLDTDQVVVGTTNSTVRVPDVGIRNSTVQVPTLGVKDDEGGAQKK